MVLPWALRPSISESVSTVFASFINPWREKLIRLERFMKSYTPRGEEKRAVPPVGRV
jgi:hypothetical protein